MLYYTWRELQTVLHDKGAILILLIALVMYPLLYSVAYSGEVLKDVPVAVVDLDHSAMSRQLSRMIDASEQVSVRCKPESLKDAEQLFYSDKVKGVILIPNDLEKDILRGKRSTVTAYCDASYFLYYKQVLAGATFATATLSGGIEIRRALTEGQVMNQAIAKQTPLRTQQYTLFNPSSGYGSFVMPGMILIIIQQTLLIGIGMVAGTRHESKMYTRFADDLGRPLGAVRLVMGKATAYVAISIFNSIVTMVLMNHWFNYPDKCNFLYTLPLLIPFFYAVAFMGLAISVLFKHRVHSLMFFMFLSPIVLFLGGISWPSEALPSALHAVAKLFPSTSVIPAYLRLRVMGAPFSAIINELLFLLIQMGLYAIIAIIAYKVIINKIIHKELNT